MLESAVRKVPWTWSFTKTTFNWDRNNPAFTTLRKTSVAFSAQIQQVFLPHCVLCKVQAYFKHFSNFTCSSTTFVITQAEASLLFTPVSAEEAACNQISCLGIVFVGSKEVSMDYLSQPETGHTVSVLSYKYKVMYCNKNLRDKHRCSSEIAGFSDMHNL